MTEEQPQQDRLSQGMICSQEIIAIHQCLAAISTEKFLADS
jgi:hypothetical protein